MTYFFKTNMNGKSFTILLKSTLDDSCLNMLADRVFQM